MPHDVVAPLFRERRAVPWWWWAVAIVLVVPSAEAVVVLGPEGSTHGSWTLGAWCLVVSLAVIAAVLLTLSRSGVEVDRAGLRAGRDVLPAAAIGRTRALDAAAARRLLGVAARADARLNIRPWVRTAVQIEVRSDPALSDPASSDPAASRAASDRNAAQPPYWVVGTRRPAQLAAALETLREYARGHEPADTGRANSQPASTRPAK